MPISTVRRANFWPTGQVAPRRNPCRRLFPAAGPDDEPNDAFVKRLLAEMRDEQARKWGYDFEADRPLAGYETQFTYKQVAAETVPGFYRMSSYSTAADEMMDDKENAAANGMGDGRYSYSSKNKLLDESGIIPSVDYGDLETEKESETRIFGASMRPTAVGLRVAPATLRAGLTARRLFDASLENKDYFDLNFEDEEEHDDLPLLNDSTSSSGSSNAGESTVATTTVTARVTVKASSEPLNESTTADEDSAIEGLLLSAKRSLSAVTPKKQSRLTEFMACRKRLQLSALADKSVADDDKFFKNLKNSSGRVILTARRRRRTVQLAVDGTPVSSRYRKRQAAGGSPDGAKRRRDAF